MVKPLCLLLIAGLSGLPANAADKKISAGDAAVIMVTQFCGAVVGESIDDITRASASVPGLVVSEPMTREQVPYPYSEQFGRTLSSEPYAVFQILSFPAANPKSGTVLGLIKRDGTLCQVTTLQAKDTADLLRKRLFANDSGWASGVPVNDASVFNRKASNG